MFALSPLPSMLPLPAPPPLSNAVLDALIDSLSPQQQLAQRFIIGTGRTPSQALSATAQQWLSVGLGGLILFRPDGEAHSNAASFAEWLYQLQTSASIALPHSNPLLLQCPTHRFSRGLPFDQEGGWIERLPPTWFPSLPSPRALGEVAQACATANQTLKADLAAEVADRFGLHFQSKLAQAMVMASTLDVNTEAQNSSFMSDLRKPGHHRCGRKGHLRAPSSHYRLIAVAKHARPWGQRAGFSQYATHFSPTHRRS
ncbi:MAG: hypothetical protein U0003_01930 [Vampirovibrionales bacterium]